MHRKLAVKLNTRGQEADARGDRALARLEYMRAASEDPTWGVPWYNLGFLAKSERNWEEGLRCNLQAAELEPGHEAAWWNLGIAATALRDWKQARRAWGQVGVNLPEGDGDCAGPSMLVAVRLSSSQEVVWGERIDPARIILLNVPLAASQRRFKDIVLNDGAPNGTRTMNGAEFPVFDELEVWQASNFVTYQISLTLPNAGAKAVLVELCTQRGLGFEDWSHNGEPVAAIAAEAEGVVREVLREWGQRVDGAGIRS